MIDRATDAEDLVRLTMRGGGASRLGLTIGEQLRDGDDRAAVLEQLREAGDPALEAKRDWLTRAIG